MSLILWAALVYLQGCSPKDQNTPRAEAAAIVQVGTQVFSRADLGEFFDSRLNEFRSATTSDEAKSALLDSFIEEKLLLIRAEQLRIQLDPKMLATMREREGTEAGNTGNNLKRDLDFDRSMLESLKIQQYLHDYLFKDLSVTKEECEAYYRQHLDEFVRNDVAHVREILVERESQAKKLMASLRASRNRNFSELARLYSRAPTASQGGDLGVFQRGDLPEVFEKVIFSLASGTISSIVRTQYGYHIFLVEEKIPAHQQKLYEVEEQIREKLLLERQRAALDKEFRSLADQIPVKVDWEKLDFKYVGMRLAPRGGLPQ